jgi:thiol-disulfide isomerase/thioredoxin
MMPQGRCLPCVATVFLCLAAVAACGRGDRPATGNPRPFDSGAVSLDGTPVSLGAMDGEVVLLNVWSVWCLPCRVEVPVLAHLQRRYAAAGLRVVGVNIDPRGDAATVRSFVRAAGIPYPVWLDFDGSLSARFPRDGVPASYLIGRGGELVWMRLGVIPEVDPGLANALHRALVPPRGEAPLRPRSPDRTAGMGPVPSQSGQDAVG